MIGLYFYVIVQCKDYNNSQEHVLLYRSVTNDMQLEYNVQIFINTEHHYWYCTLHKMFEYSY